MSSLRSAKRWVGVVLFTALTFLQGNAASLPITALTGKRVVFVGDSITYSGQYIEFLEAVLRLRHPALTFDWLNLGLPSETVSGLSEPGHAGGKFPRPDLHERLGRLIEKTQPALIVACYGMNDGIYHPLSEARTSAFQAGIEKLRAAAARAGAEIWHLTPPVFDPQPIRAQTLPAGLDEYRSPFVGYNEVLDAYSAWLIARGADAWKVIDIHGPMNAALAKGRAKDPAFRLAGDGVHMDVSGHWIVCGEILSALGVANSESLDVVSADFVKPGKPLKILERVQRRHRLLKDAWLNAVGHLRPGMAKGLALKDAQSEAANIEKELQIILARP
ncbi:MAG: SGNH/GDSL hydrolase family protein [Verrucomicrobia bacterium]|nr:SGNH/GDSL hydrolase family protein [Verrucomicrobiota bacterium]